MRGEMRWVHLRINTRVRVLGRLGCTGAFSRTTEQHARGPVTNPSSTYLQLKLGCRQKIKETSKVMSAGCTTCNTYNQNTRQSMYN